MSIVSKMQPCWTCSKFCGGCSWSRDFTPIEGWDAVPVIKYSGSTAVETYQINYCPEYESDGSVITLDKDHTDYEEEKSDLIYDGLKFSRLVQSKTKQSMNRFARSCRLDPNTVKRIWLNRGATSDATLTKIADYLQMSLEELKDAIKREESTNAKGFM